eukprot:415308_1
MSTSKENLKSQWLVKLAAFGIGSVLGHIYFQKKLEVSDLSTSITKTDAAIAFKSIVGKWIGECNGECPKRTFQYGEKIEITDTNQSFLSFSSFTWKKGDKSELMHSQTGYIRFPSSKTVDFVISHAPGIQEISSGDIIIADKAPNEGNFKIILVSNHIALVPNTEPPHPIKLKRVYSYDSSKDMFKYEIWLATTKRKQLTKHLSDNSTSHSLAFLPTFFGHHSFIYCTLIDLICR